jgi:predicted PhzF superfamily epimerase YddE/YHI9
MSRAIPYWHVDAFADRPFAGNQAAVMLLDEWLDDRVLRAIGAENNFAETAFLVPDTSGDSDWELRWFTPTDEIRLCGHATLAAGHVLLGLDARRDMVRFRTRRAGMLEVRRGDALACDGGPAYEVALPAIPTTPGEWPQAIAAMGAEPLAMRRSPDGYNLLLYGSAEEVKSLSPNMRHLAVLGPDSFTVTAPGRDTDIVSRVFIGGVDAGEDSVTGSAHAVLAPFWAERLGRPRFTAHQASARGGYLTCRLDGDRVWLGGDCVTVVEGKFHL